jgi:hypothetical protein
MVTVLLRDGTKVRHPDGEAFIVSEKGVLYIFPNGPEGKDKLADILRNMIAAYSIAEIIGVSRDEAFAGEKDHP